MTNNPHELTLSYARKKKEAKQLRQKERKKERVRERGGDKKKV